MNQESASRATFGIAVVKVSAGRRIAYTDGIAVWTMNADGSDRRLLASETVFPDSPESTWSPVSLDWSPNGQQIVVQ